MTGPVASRAALRLRAAGPCPQSITKGDVPPLADASPLQLSALGAHGFDAHVDPAYVFGSAVAGVGDLDGDGKDEIAAHSPFGEDLPAPDDEVRTGTTYVVRGRDTTTPVPVTDAANTLMRIISPQEPSALGHELALAGAGDVDGDGVDDLPVGVPTSVASMVDPVRGRVTVVYGKAGDAPVDLDDPEGAAYDITGPPLQGSDFDGFGGSFAPVGDVDGDGDDDLAIGAERTAGPAGHSIGAAYLVYGQGGGQDMTVEGLACEDGAVLRGTAQTTRSAMRSPRRPGSRAPACRRSSAPARTDCSPSRSPTCPAPAATSPSRPRTSTTRSTGASARTSATTSPTAGEEPRVDPPHHDPPRTDPPRTDPPRTDPPRTDPPRADPPKADRPRAAVATIARVSSGALRVGANGRVVLTSVRCRTATCRIGTPRSVRLTIDRRRFAARMVAPRRLRTGQSGTVRLVLSRKARRALVGRTATVRVRVVVRAGEGRVARTISVKLRRPRG